MKFSIILAVDSKNWIWKNNSLAWNIPSDMQYFKKITSNTTDLNKVNAVIMWKNTWESIPDKYRPLPNRINCILTRKINNNSVEKSTLYFNSLEDCLSKLELKENIENVFIIGWANLYNQVLNNPMIDKIYLTKVTWDYNCDVFFNWIPENFRVILYTEPEVENGIEYSYWVYKKN